ncbi:hypothetical protein ACH5RR_027619 [Cinchona calisaya]|uniref:PIN-like protein n=1 Tax=Cinchona calisaya TaxID=153742 RepID=A0ABD2Z5Y8_9GENT
MLLIIIPAVCKEKGSPFGAPDVCHSYGMAYASLSMAVCFCPLFQFDEITYERSEECPHQFALPSSSLEDIAQASLSDKIKRHVEMVARKVNLKALFAPSTSGAIIGFVVGLVPQFRRSIIGDSAPLRVIQDTALLLGDGAIPAVTLIMGGNLLEGLQVSGIPISIVVGILIARYVVLPLLGIAIVKVALQLGLVHNNPLYQFVILLQFAVPPAMNIGITQLFGAGESESSVIML